PRPPDVAGAAARSRWCWLCRPCGRGLPPPGLAGCHLPSSQEIGNRGNAGVAVMMRRIDPASIALEAGWVPGASDHEAARDVILGSVRTVIIVNDHAFICGGQSRIAIESALSLKRAGIDVVYFAGSGPADSRLEKAGVEVVVLGLHDLISDPHPLRAACQGLWNRQAAEGLASVLADHDPLSTVVHVHGWCKTLSPSIGPVVTRGP